MKTRISPLVRFSAARMAETMRSSSAGLNKLRAPLLNEKMDKMDALYFTWY